MSDNRIQALEEKLAFLEDTIQRLNDALVDQQRQLTVAQNHYEELRQKYLDLARGDAMETTQADQKPPHY